MVTLDHHVPLHDRADILPSGMNEYDKLQAQHKAKENSSDLYDQHYKNADEYNPNQYDRPNFNY